MNCKDAQTKMNAWTDDELSRDNAGGLAAHVAACRTCGHEAGQLTALTHLLDTLETPAPSGKLKFRTLDAFNAESRGRKQSYDWGFALPAVGWAAAGLVLGIVMGCRLFRDAGLYQVDLADIFFFPAVGGLLWV